MLPRNRTPKPCKFLTHRSLLIVGESPLPHPPSYLADCSASYPESNSADYSAGYPVENPESYPDCNSVSYSASYPKGNSPSYSGDCGDGCPAGCSADCPENRSRDSPEGNLPSNWEYNPEDYSDSYWVNCLPGRDPRSLSFSENDLPDGLKLVA
jgi:hypothetical protein